MSDTAATTQRVLQELSAAGMYGEPAPCGWFIWAPEDGHPEWAAGDETFGPYSTEDVLEFALDLQAAGELA